MTQSPVAFHVRYQIRTVLRQWKKLFLFNLAVIILISGLIVAWPRTYRSEAKLWVKLGHENSTLDPTATTGETISIQESDREDEIRSVMDIIGSKGIVAETVDALGPSVVLGDEPLPGTDGSETQRRENQLAKKLKQGVGTVIGVVKSLDPISKREEAILQVTKNIAVEAERKSNVVSIAFDSDSPALAQAIVDTLIEKYKEEHARIHYTSESQVFFSEQRENLRERVATSAAALKNAKDLMGIASTSGQRSILEAEMLNVQLAKLEVARSQAEAEARVRQLELELDDQPERILVEESTVPNTGRDSLRTQLYQLQVERMKLEATYKNGHPRLAALRTQEEDAREELSGKTTETRVTSTEALNQIRQSLLLELAQAKANISGNTAKLSSLIDQEQAIVEQIAKLNAAEVDIRHLERELALAENSYSTYADDYEDSRLNEALNETAISNISVAQSATFEEKPVSPSKAILALMGMAMMFSGSLAISAGSGLLHQVAVRNGSGRTMDSIQVPHPGVSSTSAHVQDDPPGMNSTREGALSEVVS